MNPEISLDTFSLRYSPTAEWVLSDLTFDIPRGSCCAVLGSTSSGKTTLLHAVSGLLGKYHHALETKGSFHINGRDGSSIPRDILFPSVGLVTQDPRVMISGMHNTVEDEIAFTLQNIGVDTSEIHEKINAVLTRLKIHGLAQRHPLQLSGGETQRVALATILVAEPKILLLDEPRNSLDSGGQDTLAHILLDLRGHTTVVFSDYEIDLAFSVADYIIVLDRGECIYQGSKYGFLERFEEFFPLVISDSWKETLPLLVKKHPPSATSIRRLKKLFGLSYV